LQWSELGNLLSSQLANKTCQPKLNLNIKFLNTIKSLWVIKKRLGNQVMWSQVEKVIVEESFSCGASEQNVGAATHNCFLRFTFFVKHIGESCPCSL
jgi:hypothetical protein